MNRLLAFDTSTAACAVGVQVGEIVYTQQQIAVKQQTQLLLPTIDALLQQAQLSLSELDAIAVGCGPGSYTGIRLACSAAQGLAYAAKLPVILLSSLALLAQTAALQAQLAGVKYFLVAVDARAQQIYWAVYQLDLTGIVQCVGDEQLCAPQAIRLPHGVRQLQPAACVAVGDGWKVYEQELIQYLGGRPKQIDAELLPQAGAALRLASVKFAQQEIVSALAALPAYL